MHEQFQKLALAVIETEAAAIHELIQRIDHDFARACQYLLDCPGHIVVLGMGKSGHIGSKIAATLASTGTPAFFVHPAEAGHGDMGMITEKDVILAISNSGNTDEIRRLLPLIKRLQVPMITLTGNPDSPLAQAASVNIDVSVAKEACPLGLAPTASTTAALVMGDALAIALLETRGFTAQDFALAHPGGTLGRRLLLHVDDIMHSGDNIPCVPENTVLKDALLEITAKKLGMTCVVNEHGQLTGLFTDGDLRRTLDKSIDLNDTCIQEVMTHSPKTLQQNTLVVDALNLMERYQITAIAIVNEEHKPIGVTHIHDILKAGVL